MMKALLKICGSISMTTLSYFWELLVKRIKSVWRRWELGLNWCSLRFTALTTEHIAPKNALE